MFGENPPGETSTAGFKKKLNAEAKGKEKPGKRGIQVPKWVVVPLSTQKTVAPTTKQKPTRGPIDDQSSGWR